MLSKFVEFLSNNFKYLRLSFLDLSPIPLYVGGVMFRTISSLGIGVVLIFSLTGCGSYVASEYAPPHWDYSEGCGNQASCLPEKPELDIDGEVNAGPFGTFSIIELDKLNNILSFNLPLPFNPLGTEVEGDLRNLPGAKWAIRKNSKGNWELSLLIPIELIVNGVKFAEPAKLPNGDPLPGIPGGELPKVGLDIDRGRFEGSLFLGVEAMGIFVPTPGFNPFLKLTFPIKSKNQRKVLGYLSTVPEKRAFDGGFFLSFRIPDGLARLIDGN